MFWWAVVSVGGGLLFRWRLCGGRLGQLGGWLGRLGFLEHFGDDGVLGLLLDAVDETVDFDARGGIDAFVEEIDDVAMHSILALGVAHVVLGVWLEWTCAVDGFAVGFEPFANLLHTQQAWLWDFAVGVGANVEEQVAAFGYNVA